MRLSEWRAASRVRDATSAKVVAAVEPVLVAFGAEADPHCWVAWGDDPASRYLLMVPTASGLLMVVVRVNVPGEGPRASAKLVRWPKVQVGELAIETSGDHRLLSFQVESQVMKGADATADAIARFALVVFAAIDGRSWPSFDPPRGRRGARTAARGRASTAGTRKPTATTAKKSAAAKAVAAPMSAAAPKRAPARSAAPKRLGPGR
jgi:hypothetical protein